MGSSTCMSMSACMEMERREIERLRVQDYVKNIHSSIPSPSQRISNKHTRTHTHSDRNRAKIVFFRSIAFQYLPSETLHRLFHLHECAWDWFDFASSTPAIKFNEMGKINMWSIGLLKHQISTIKSLNTHTRRLATRSKITARQFTWCSCWAGWKFIIYGLGICDCHKGTVERM